MADKSLYDVCEQLRANSDRNTALLTTLNSSVLKLNNMMGSFLDIMNQQRMDMLEAMREQKSDKAAAKTESGQKPSGGSNIAMILAGIAAIASGFLTGILDSVKALAKLARLDKAFDAIKSAIRGLGSGMRARFVAFADDALRILDDLIKPLKTFFSAEGGFARFIQGLRNTFRQTFTGAAKIFDDLIQPFKTLMSGEGVVGQRITKLFNSIVDIFKFPFEGIIDDVVKPFRAIYMSGEGPSVLSRIIGTITRPFTAAVDFVTGLIKPITTFFSAEGPIAKAFGVIRQAFAIFSEGSQLMGMLNGIGRVIGRLFYPITLIMTAYDTIKGALAGYEDEGIIGAIQGAITGLLNSVIGMPLDLLKSVVAWLLDKFGFDEAADALAGFSFSDIISKIVDTIFDVFKHAINAILSTVADLVDKVPGLGGVAESIRGMQFDTNVQERKALDAQIEEQEKKQSYLRKTSKTQERIYDSMERAAMKDGVITPDEQAKLDKQMGRLERASSAYDENTNQIETLRQERAALDGGGGVNVDASSTDNSSSSSSAMITQPPGAVDVNDPALAGA